jgi:hypothetical protein
MVSVRNRSGMIFTGVWGFYGGTCVANSSSPWNSWALLIAMAVTLVVGIWETIYTIKMSKQKPA